MITMRTADAIAMYGSQAAVARAAGVTRAAVAQWVEWVSEPAAYRLWLASGGRQQVDREHYAQARRGRRAPA